MDYEYEIKINNTDAAADDGTTVTPTTELVRGVEVKPGDKIQITCVYNSMDRTEDTEFGFSTYDEMCVVSLYVTFETPPHNTAGEDGGTASSGGGIDFIADLNLRVFKCEVDDENHTTDVWQGTLEEDEDPRNIYFDHPIDESDMCIFPVADFVLMDVALTGDTRNCPTEGEGDADADNDTICDGFSSSSKAEFLPDAIAGYTCVGG